MSFLFFLSHHVCFIGGAGVLSSNTSAWQLAYVASLVREVHLLLYVSFGKLKT